MHCLDFSAIVVHYINVLILLYIAFLLIHSLPTSGRALRPLPLGVALTRSYKAIDPDLSLPTMRRRVERQLALIAQGRLDFKPVVERLLRTFRSKFRYFIAHLPRLDRVFALHFTPSSAAARAAASAVLFTDCGDCGNAMRLLLPASKAVKVDPATGAVTTGGADARGAPLRLYCVTCAKLYLLPSNGIVRKFPALVCPYDGFGVVYFTTNGDPPVSYPLCPCCYNHPPYSGSANASGSASGLSAASGGLSASGGGHGEMSCDKCRHPTCPQSVLARGVRPCPNAAASADSGGGCGGGVLVLHTLSRPNWRLGCSHCNYTVKFAKGAHRVRLLRKGDALVSGSGTYLAGEGGYGVTVSSKAEYEKPEGWGEVTASTSGSKGAATGKPNKSKAKSSAKDGADTAATGQAVSTSSVSVLVAKGVLAAVNTITSSNGSNSSKAKSSKPTASKSNGKDDVTRNVRAVALKALTSDEDLATEQTATSNSASTAPEQQLQHNGAMLGDIESLSFTTPTSNTLSRIATSAETIASQAKPPLPTAADYRDVAVCPFCSSALFHIECHRENPLARAAAPYTGVSSGAAAGSGGVDGLVYQGCLFCDPVLAATATAAYGNAELDDGRGRGGVRNMERATVEQAQRREKRREEGREREERVRNKRDALEL